MTDEKDTAFEFDNAEGTFDNTENAIPATEDEEKKPIELPHVVKLSTPVTVGKKSYSELTFQNRLTVGMLQHFVLSEGAAQKVGHFIGPIAKMTGEPTAVIQALTWDDFNTCMAVVLHFF